MIGLKTSDSIDWSTFSGSAFFNEDCMKALVRMPDNFAELAIIDPPYGIGASKIGKHGPRIHGVSFTNYKKGKWDNERPSEEYFSQLFRVSKNVMVWGGNYFTDYLPPSKHWVIWDKEQPPGMHFAQFEMCWLFNGNGFRIFKRSVSADKNNISNNPALARRNTRIHPTQKPVALYRWLLENYAKPGDLILDTHVGSASSLIACEQMGFEYVGFELDPDYYEAAKNRMAKGIQTNLFAHGTNAPQNRDEQLTIFQP